MIVEAVRDPVTGNDCWCVSEVVFRLQRAARVTLRVSGRTVSGNVDGGEWAMVSEIALEAGTHRVSLPGGELDDVASIAPFALDAREEGGRVETAAGILEGDLNNPPVLVVGRVFVRWTDLWDGHAVHQATDYEGGTDPISLRVVRTYTSAGRGSAGLVGAGWSFNWQLTLTPHAGCGLYVVRVADGTSLAFRRREDGTFEPPPGYNSRLISNPDGSFDFYNLAGYRYRFERPADARDFRGKLRLQSIVAPDGGLALVRYDVSGRLVEARAESTEKREVWFLDFGYTSAGGFERLAWVRDRKDGVEVRYGYDAFGNLVSVERKGPPGQAASWRYAYSVDDARDRHQLVEAEDPEGKTSFAYYRDADAFEGEGPRALGLQLFGKGEYVREAGYAKGGGPVETTRYAYDYSGWKDGVFRTRVNSSEGSMLYVLDARGRMVEMREELSSAHKVSSDYRDPSNSPASSR